jgi:hypothetical protein
VSSARSGHRPRTRLPSRRDRRLYGVGGARRFTDPVVQGRPGAPSGMSGPCAYSCVRVPGLGPLRVPAHRRARLDPANDAASPAGCPCRPVALGAMCGRFGGAGARQWPVSACARTGHARSARSGGRRRITGGVPLPPGGPRRHVRAVRRSRGTTVARQRMCAYGPCALGSIRRTALGHRHGRPPDPCPPVLHARAHALGVRPRPFGHSGRRPAAGRRPGASGCAGRTGRGGG